MSAWVWPLVAALMSALLCRRFLDPRSALHLLDRPGDRSLHRRPTPRTGGVALVIALLVAWGGAVLAGALPFRPHLAGLAGGVVLLALVGGIDDWRGLSPWARLPVQLLAALTVLVAGLGLQVLRLPGWSVPLSAIAGTLLTLLFVLWMTNLYNFMDGMDGLAGSMALVGFGTLAAIAAGAGVPALALVALCVAGAAVGFLWFNRPPARLFMGDAGAPVLGFLAAALMLWAERSGAMPLWVGMLLFSPFVVDATYTLIRRLLRREPVWQAHCSHLYQKEVRRLGAHGPVLARAWGLMLACAASAWLAPRLSPPAADGLLLFWVLAYGGLIVRIERAAAGRA